MRSSDRSHHRSGGLARRVGSGKTGDPFRRRTHRLTPGCHKEGVTGVGACKTHSGDRHVTAGRGHTRTRWVRARVGYRKQPSSSACSSGVGVWFHSNTTFPMSPGSEPETSNVSLNRRNCSSVDAASSSMRSNRSRSSFRGNVTVSSPKTGRAQPHVSAAIMVVPPLDFDQGALLIRPSRDARISGLTTSRP